MTAIVIMTMMVLKVIRPGDSQGGLWGYQAKAGPVKKFQANAGPGKKFKAKSGPGEKLSLIRDKFSKISVFVIST